MARALQRQSWRIIARNYRHIGFELDIVALKGGTMIVVEVKARRHRPHCERGFSVLLPRKKRDALLRGAVALSSRLQFSCNTIRVDLAIAYKDGLGRPRIEYHVNAPLNY